MKKIYYLLPVYLLLVFISCQEEDANGGVGYLRLEIATNAFVNPQTKIAEDYNPKQIAVQIINGSGTVVKETDDYTIWNSQQIRLSPGTYTIKASSNGFDGSESGFDIPYYAGSEQITIESGKEKTANVTCTLANVKVTVNFDQSFIDAFKSAKTTVASALKDVSALDFEMGKNNRSAYYPVGDLSATVSVVNKADKEFSQTNEITNVKARDHYILNYKVAESGTIGGVDVSVDDTEKTYTFTFNVSTKATTTLAVSTANAWSNFAYVEGEITSSQGTLDSDKMTFEYKLKNAEAWTSTSAIFENNNKFKATLHGLTPGTKYTYRMVYKGTEEYASEPLDFTTETQNKVPNLSFDDWYKDGRSQYACAEADFSNKFWDSGNKGANTLKEINPTSPETSDVKAGKAARLASTTAAGQFAAGSLFSGNFISASISPLGAKLNFGQPFTERPSRLTGWYKYNPGTIDKIKTDKVSAVAQGDRDICSIYIALADWSAPFAVSTGDDQFVDFTSSSIIAYGELPADKTSPENMSDYEQFTIDLKYRDLTRKPTYILIVCSSSKYGDYFTGSTSSVLLLDEFDLIYGEPTVDPDYIN